MGFDHPGALWLLGLILLLLFARRRTAATRLQVATLHLWQSIAPPQPTVALRRPRRDLIAMCLQAAFLVASIGALARPFLSPPQSPVVVVIDLSRSMGARHAGSNRIDQAKAQIREWLDTLPRRTPVYLIGAHASPELLGAFKARDPGLRALLATLRAWDTPGDLRAALARARTEHPVSIHVFSDHQRPPGAAPDVVWSTVGAPGANVAITGLSLRDALVPRDGRELVAGIRNYGPAPVRTSLAIELDGVPFASLQLTLQPGTLPAVAVRVGNVSGIVTARLDIQDDLPSDNVRRMVLEPARPVRIRIQSASRFLRQALAVLPSAVIEDGPVRPESGAPDIVVCDGCTSLPEGRSAVLFAPAAPVARGELLPLVPTNVKHLIGEFVPFGDVTVAAAGSNDAGEDAVVIARAGGVPAILASTSASARRVVELRFDLSRSPLALDPAFPVVIWNVVQWLAENDSGLTATLAGESPGWQSAPGTTGEIGSGNQSRATTIRTEQGAIADTRAAGVYRVRAGGREHRVVVNPAIEGESDLSSAPLVDENIPELPPAREPATEMTPWLLLAALAVLALESVVRRGRVRLVQDRHAVR